MESTRRIKGRRKDPVGLLKEIIMGLGIVSGLYVIFYGIMLLGKLTL